MFDWEKIKKEYLIMNITQVALAEKYGVKVSTLRSGIYRDRWNIGLKKFNSKDCLLDHLEIEIFVMVNFFFFQYLMESFKQYASVMSSILSFLWVCKRLSFAIFSMRRFTALPLLLNC